MANVEPFAADTKKVNRFVKRTTPHSIGKYGGERGVSVREHQRPAVLGSKGIDYCTRISYEKAATRQCTGMTDDNELGYEGLEMVLQGDMAIYRPKTTSSPATYSENNSSIHRWLIAHQTIPQSTLDGSVDPFGTTGAGLEKKEAILLDFFSKGVFPRIFPLCDLNQTISAQKIWFMAAFADPASLHGILCLAALQMTEISAYFQPKESVALALRHRASAIEAVQKNLADPVKAISDMNIAAVFSLLCLEENLFSTSFSSLTGIKQDPAHLVAHAKGLKDMLRLRGGATGISSSKLLQHLIARYCVTRAGSTFDRKHLPPRGLTAQIYDSYPVSSTYYDEATSMADKCRKLGLNVSLINLVKSIDCLSRDSRDWMRTPNNHRFDLIDIQSMWVMLSGEVLECYLGLEESGTLTPLDGIVGLCLLLFVGLVVRARVMAFGGGTSLIWRLSKCLSEGGGESIEALRRTNLDVWVGVVLVLSPALHPDYERQMWAIYLGSMRCQKSAFKTSADLKKHLLKHSLWWPEKLDKFVDTIWDSTVDVWRRPEQVISGIAGVSFAGVTGGFKATPCHCQKSLCLRCSL
ncbi:hypothetical protein N7526_004212 [Penicillium atrosanguineum]|nr:hypothetical protein N7526_004212 [Penicillium atrosanguineum]